MDWLLIVRTAFLLFKPTYAPGRHSAISAALNLPSDIEIQACRTEPAGVIRMSLMRRPVAPDGAGSEHQASGFRKKRKDRVLSLDPFSLPSSLKLPESGFRNPESGFSLNHSCTQTLLFTAAQRPQPSSLF
jgi:hypothetical protein